MTFNQLSNKCFNDFEIKSNNAGEERILTVKNAIDFAGSAATIQAQVQGAASGDAKFQAINVGGTQTWAWGMDNSNADKFVLSGAANLGAGSDVMQVYPAGQINYPLQPVFSAQAVSQPNVTGDGTTYTVQFTNEIVDIGNNFDGTSTFTAPVTGIYQFGVICSLDGVAAGHTDFDCQIVLSTGALYILDTCNLANNASGAVGNIYKSSGYAIIPMTALDTATVQVFATGGAKTIGIYTLTSGMRFFGSLIA